MSTIVALISVMFGIAGLIAGGEVLIRSSSKLAAAVGISPLVIGLTVVALATSAPELAVVVQSALRDKADLAIGNAVGSNILNVLFVLGVSALVAPVIVTSRLILWDVPLMIGASILLLLLSLDGRLGRADGALLFGLLLAYVTWTIRESRKARLAVMAEYAGKYGPNRRNVMGLQVVLLVLGLALLVVGAHLTVDGSVVIAKALGASELIIGLTVIAVGTSLPEVVTSIVASYRGEREIAVGNVIGSNMFNILGVLGVGSAIAQGGIAVTANAIRFDMPVMIVVAIVCLPIFFVDSRISRWEGGLFFGYYLVYVVYLFLDATGHGFGRILDGVLILFVLPLTAISITVSVYRYLRRRALD